MRPKAVTLILRIWQAADGTVKSSVKPAAGGETLHFPNLAALMHYLDHTLVGPQEEPGESPGLR